MTTTPRAVLAALVLCVAPALAMAADMPLQPGQRPVAGSTEAELWYAMDQSEKELRTSPLVVRDPALNRYVHDVLCKVAGDYCPDLRLYVLDVPVFNASMAPNGTTIVFTGALLRMHDEAELAYVLAHEFAHYRQRHSLQSWQKAKRTTAFLSTFSLLTLGLDGGISGNLAYLMGLGALANHSRDKEREADHEGFKAASTAGYDPDAVVEMWKRLRQEELADPRHKDAPAFASHPRTEERIADNLAAAATVKAAGGDWRRERETFRSARMAFLPHWLDAELGRRKYDVSICVLKQVDDDATDAEQAATTFRLAEAYRRRNKGQDRDAATRLYVESTGLPDAPPQAWRERGLDEFSRGDRAAAAASLRRYIALRPDADDAGYIAQYLKQTETPP